MVLSFAIVSNIAVNARKFIYYVNNNVRITSLKQKREERQFVNLRIFLMLHSGNEFLEKVLNLCPKLDGIVPRYGNTIKISFLGTVGITFFET